MAISSTAGQIDYKIDKIYINGVPGKVFGGSIFDCKMTIGYSGSPTTFTVSVIEPEGNYQIAEDERDARTTSYPYPSYLTPWLIQIGDTPQLTDNTTIIFKMYLESWKISSQMGSKTLEATFVDGSTILDRIFVGLIDKHIDPDKYGFKSGRTYAFQVPILCETPHGECGDLNKYGNCTGLVNRSLSFNTPVKGGWYLRRGDRREEGGGLWLGFHEINTKNASKECAIPDVRYNLSELIYYLSIPEGSGGFGIPILNKWDSDLPSLWDRDPLIRKNYTGTLREVLTKWCADYSFEFLWSFDDSGIIGVDRSSRIDYIKQIKQKVEQVTKQPITDISYEVSKKGTKINRQVTSVIREAKSSQEQLQTIYRKAVFAPLDFSHVLDSGFYGGNRTDSAMRISVGLSKFKLNSARKIFNCAVGAYGALGFRVIGEVSCTASAGEIPPGMGPPKNVNENAGLDVSICDALISHFGDAQLQQVLNGWKQMVPGGAWPNFPGLIPRFGVKALLVEYSEEWNDHYKKLEENIADKFIGQYYVNFNTLQNEERCEKIGHFKRTDSLTPRSSTYFSQDRFNVPFAGLLGDGTDAIGLRLNPKIFDVEPTINLHDRGKGTWGTTQFLIDNLLKSPPTLAGSSTGLGVGQDLLLPFVPIFRPLNGQRLADFLSIFPGIKPRLADVLRIPSIFNMLPIDIKKLMDLGGLRRAGQITSQIGILIHPDYNHTSFKDKVFNITNVSWGTCNNALISLDTAKASAKSQKDANKEELTAAKVSGQCKDLCSFNPELEACNTYYKLVKSYPFAEGVTGRNAFCFRLNFDVTGTGLNFFQEDVIFPPWTALSGNQKIDVWRRRLLPAVKEIYENIIPPGDVAGMRVGEVDAGNIIYKTSGKVEIGVPIGVSWAARRAGYTDLSTFKSQKIEIESVAVEEFHNAMTSPTGTLTNMNIIDNSKTLSFTVAGLVFEPSVLPYITRPDLGLQRMDITVGSDGISTSFEFSSRPIKEPSQELLMNTIKTYTQPMGTP